MRALLETNANIEVIGEAGDGYEAVTLTEKMKPDIMEG